MYKFLGAFLVASICINHLQAQDLYIPRDIQAAYQKQTRSMDGRPGKNYWQNRGRYNITVTATPPSRTIKGSETISYFNNSNDTIRNPNIKLFMNIHKAGAGRDYTASAEYLTDGIKIDKITVNGTGLTWPENSYPTVNKQLRLQQPLVPHDSLKLSFEWHYDLSVESGREGMLDPTTFFLAYFYPRIAVFDDYMGWDRMSFTDGKEFYSDFNDYNLTVNVPANYVVWATGDLQNADKVLQPDFLKKYNQSLKEDNLVHVATKADMDGKKVTLQQTNSWLFISQNIPDVALTLSNHYVWDASSVVVDKKANRRASVQAAFMDTAADFHRMVEFAKHSLDWFSNNWPGVPYPYSKTTVVQGFADMEYPMMVNDNTTGDMDFSRFVAEHEIAHTYFPFYMGINETRYGFMDEGWATTLELLISQADLGEEKAADNFKQFRVSGWINDKNQEEDVSIITPGNNLSGAGLGNNEYGKAALGYLAVKELLGDEVFKKSLQEYMARWNGKHPTPWDFFFSINDASGKNLNWFWNSWFFSNGYIDMAVTNVTPSDKGYTVAIKNNGGFPAPFNAIINYTDGAAETIHQTPALWQNNLKEAQLEITTKKKIKTLVIDGGIFMDATLENNSWPGK